VPEPDAEQVGAFLAGAGARPWQVELTAQAISEALAKAARSQEA
jgi:hypothetical protein